MRLNFTFGPEVLEVKSNVTHNMYALQMGTRTARTFACVSNYGNLKVRV